MSMESTPREGDRRSVELEIELSASEIEALESASERSEWTDDVEGWVRDAIRLRLANREPDEMLPIHRSEIGHE